VVVNNTININNTNNHLYLKSLNTQKNTTYGVGNPGPGLGQTQKCGRVKSVNGILNLLFLIMESPNAIYEVYLIQHYVIKFVSDL
jgi:hypothetical protein